MPDNVETSIVSASSLLNKFVVNKSGEKQLVAKRENSGKKRKVFKALDGLENDSTEEASSSLETEDEEISGNDDDIFIANVQNEGPKKLKVITNFNKKVIAQSKHPSNHDNPSMATFVNGHSFLMKSDKELKIPDFKEQQHALKSIVDKKNIALTSDEKDLFRNHYVPESASFEVEPNLLHSNKEVNVAHSQKISGVISLFDDERNDDKKRTIEMNYTKCLARNMVRDMHKVSEAQNKSQADNSIAMNHLSHFDFIEGGLDDILGFQFGF